MHAVIEQIRKFNAERDWDKFHSPKNLAISISIEAAELLEIFQWKSEEESKCLTHDERERIQEEISDILIYLLNLSDKLDFNLIQSVNDKILKNAKKYPVDLVKGKSTKYTEYR